MPDGYTELKYIETNSSYPYINTGTTTNTNMRIVVDAEALTFHSSLKRCSFVYSTLTSGSKYTSCQIYIANSSSSNSIHLVAYSNASNPSTTGYTINVGSETRFKIDWDFKNKTAIVNNGEQLTVTGLATSFAYSIALNIPAGNTQSNGFTMRLYSYQYYLSDVLQSDLVPCTNPSGMVGMYDLVKEKFLSSANTSATFIAGPKV